MLFGKKDDSVNIHSVRKEYLKELLNEIADGACARVLQKLGYDIHDYQKLQEDIEQLKKDKKEFELQKQMDEREIKQLVKIKEENQEIEFRKKELKLKEEYIDKEKKLLEGFHEKQLTEIEKSREELKSLYREIMTRLPNVNASLNFGDQPNAKKD